MDIIRVDYAGPGSSRRHLTILSRSLFFVTSRICFIFVLRDIMDAFQYHGDKLLEHLRGILRYWREIVFSRNV